MLIVEFDQNSYSAMEGQDVTFTVVLSNEAEITVTVDFTTADITAQGMKFIVSDTQL